MKAEHAGFEARLDAARLGDPAAWSVLYHDLAPLVIGYLRAQRLADAEDVAGEVMLELVRDLERFDGGEAALRSWVLAIAHHRLLDARRRASRRPQITDEVTDAGVEPCAEDDPEAETLAALGFGRLEPALTALTEDQRTVLLLRVIGDLPIADVARITGRRPGAVKQLQRRAAAAMRRQLSDGGRDGSSSGVTPAGREPRERSHTASGNGRSATEDGRPDDQRWDSERAHRTNSLSGVAPIETTSLAETHGRSDGR